MKEFVTGNGNRLMAAWCSGNEFHPISEVTLCRASLVLGWVTACSQMNYLGM